MPSPDNISASPGDAPLKLPLLLAYGLLALPLAALTGPVFAVLPTYFITDLGLSAAAVGLALLIARLWDGVCDPTFGIMADRISLPLGRRLPWIALGVPLTIAGGWGLFLPAADISPVMIGVWSVLLYTGWTAMKLNHDALGSELSADYHQRVRITSVREGLGLVGGLVAILLLGWGIDPSGPGLGAAFTALFWAVVAGLLIGLVALVLLVREPQHAPSGRMTLLQVRAMLREDADLRRLCISHFLSQLAAAFPATLFLLYVEFALARPDLKAPLILVYFFSAVVAVPGWIALSRRVGKHRAWRWGMLVTAVLFAPVVFFREGSEIWFAVICVGTGGCLAADLVFPPAIQADLADAETSRSGARPAGLMFALLGLITKVAYALGVGLAFPLLDLAGFAAQAGSENTAPALWVLALLYAAMPAGLKLASWVLLRDFSLDEGKLAVTRAAAGG